MSPLQKLCDVPWCLQSKTNVVKELNIRAGPMMSVLKERDAVLIQTRKMGAVHFYA